LRERDRFGSIRLQRTDENEAEKNGDTDNCE